MLASRIGTLCSRPSAVASVTSLWARRSANDGGSNLFGRNWSIRPSNVAAPAARPLPHRLPQRERIDARLDAHREDLGQRGLDDVARAVVDELRDRSGADRPDVVGLIADRVEHRPVLVEDLLVAADPQRQLPALGAARPPLTGASSMWMPRRLNTSWIFRTSPGELVDRSKYALPATSPAPRPCSPSATDSTSGGPGSDVKTTSVASATARGVSAHTAPACTWGAAASRRTSLTTSWWPPFIKLDAM